MLKNLIKLAAFGMMMKGARRYRHGMYGHGMGNAMHYVPHKMRKKMHKRMKRKMQKRMLKHALRKIF